jgi:hypothetical protein
MTLEVREFWGRTGSGAPVGAPFSVEQDEFLLRHRGLVFPQGKFAGRKESSGKGNRMSKRRQPGESRLRKSGTA